MTPGSLYQPSAVILPRNLIEFVYPKGFLTWRVNNSGDISWHKDRVFISEVFRFEELGFELVADASTRFSSASSRSESSTLKLCVLGLCRCCDEMPPRTVGISGVREQLQRYVRFAIPMKMSFNRMRWVLPSGSIP